MNIVFSANNKYASYLGTAVLSILDSNPNKYRIVFYVLTIDISPDNQEMLRTLVCAYKNASITFIYIDDTAFKDFPLNIKHITQEAYFRYLIPDILPRAQKALYLDVDILVLGDIYGLYSIDINNYFIAGSHKDYFAKEFPGYKTTIGLKEDDLYINSGVMLLNLEKIREAGKVAELFENTKKLKNIIKIQDQDIINITFNKGIKNFSNIYNYTESDRRISDRKNEEVVIVHFNTGNKPWNLDFQITETNMYFADKYQETHHKFVELTIGKGLQNDI